MLNNYGQLKTSVAKYSNRTNIDDVVPDFILAAHLRLVEVVGALTAMSEDTDTNAFFDYDPNTYLWGALAEAGLYLKDEELMSYYGAKFQTRLDDLAMTGFDTIGGVPSVGTVV